MGDWPWMQVESPHQNQCLRGCQRLAIEGLAQCPSPEFHEDRQKGEIISTRSEQLRKPYSAMYVGALFRSGCKN